MHIRVKYLLASISLAAVFCLAALQPVSAHGLPPDPDPVPIKIYGHITDHGTPVPNLNVVAWCGGLDWFGGWDYTDANGYFEIHTNGKDCHLLEHGFLEILHNDSSVGFAFGYMIIHSDTLVNVKLEEHSTANVPEFGWFGGVASLAAGGAAIVFMRRRLAS
jgi:hypothetical protein